MKCAVEGLKQLHTAVAPYVGAWIEMKEEAWEKAESHVAPYVGAWIEIVI